MVAASTALCSALLTAGLLIACNSSAQTNGSPVRLAIISESAASASVADLLTVELSGKPRLQLLERAEIEKVYREQGLSAANRDFLKLAQILGADGLLLLTPVSEGTNQFMQARLVAVKPGVILASVRSVWPVEDATGWARWLANHFGPLFPKLGVLAKDALPISVVNLRAAVKSAEEEETERQLTVLAIERLTHERELFVLERRRMELLSAEKELKGLNESAFWNGSYLLDGVIDRDGYSKETVTIHARLVPPKGGAPMPIEISGSRTNLAGVINQLVGKVMQGLKLGPHSTPWSPADEAQTYFEEANWALKWGMISEAQAAAESAWGLGKQDLECAVVRVKAYAVSPDYDKRQTGPLTTTYVNPSREMAAARPPTRRSAEAARRALAIYLNFSRTLPAESIKTNAAWYRLGIEDLTVASRVLQHFHLVTEALAPLAGEVAELRVAARSVADWLSRLPMARDTYFVGDRIPSSDELYQNFQVAPNIFICEINWGAFWQERPEDSVLLYRELMRSPLFACLHEKLWFRAPNNPRLVAWNVEDDKRIPTVWRSFMDELESSTNFALRIESKAIEFADAANAVEAHAEKGKELEPACETLFSFIFTNYDVIVACNEHLLYLDWGLGNFFGRGGLVTPAKEKLDQEFKALYAPKLAALRNDYRARNIESLREKENAPAFERQKQYLANQTPYNFVEFIQCFSFQDYSKNQAIRLQPLVAAYKSNLLAQAEGKAPWEQAKARGDAHGIEFRLEKRLNKVLNAPQTPAVRTPARAERRVGPPATVQTAIVTTSSVASAASVITNAFPVRNHLRIPIEQLQDSDISGLTITAHRWSEGKLLLGLSYQGSFQNYSLVSQAAVGIFNPQNGTWDIIKFPKDSIHDVSVNTLRGGFLADSGRSSGAHFELFKGDFYLSDGGRIRKFDFKSRQWKILEIPEYHDSKFFVIAGRLFAANAETIFEITDVGRGMRILASTRRRPAASALDSLDTLGSPALFAGPNRLPRTYVNNRIFSWDGSDWHEAGALNASQPPEVFEEAVIFRSFNSLEPGCLWILENNETSPQLCLRENPRLRPNPAVRPPRKPAAEPQPLWHPRQQEGLVTSPAVFLKSKLFFFVDNPTAGNPSDSRNAASTGDYASLVCLNRGVAEPLLIPLKFGLESGQPHVQSSGPRRPRGMGTYSGWMQLGGSSLFLWRADFPGLWSISTAEVEAAVATALQRNADQ